MPTPPTTAPATPAARTGTFSVSTEIPLMACAADACGMVFAVLALNGDEWMHQVGLPFCPYCGARQAPGPWLETPTQSGWWWLWEPTMAPKGICVLVHDDGVTHPGHWWVYLPKRIHPVRLDDLPRTCLWQGPVAKPQTPSLPAQP